jgi:hypothetical protein
MRTTWQWESFGGKNRSAGSTASDALIDAGLTIADLVAREVTQNSDDAMDRFRFREEFRGIHEPSLTFVFRALTGADKHALVETLDLESVRQHAGAIANPRTGEDLLPSSGLANLDDPNEPLNLLYAIEQGAIGLEGDPIAHPDESRWYLAMESQGVTFHDDKERQSGGSWGFGKAAFQLGSRIATVIAYSRFADGGDGVTTRLGGYFYSQKHRLDDQAYSGFAQFGVTSQDGYTLISEPFQNSQADEYARLLGMERPVQGNINDLGTTFLMVDPAITPADLRHSLESYWWPSILDESLDIDIIDYDGSSLTPRPKRREREDLQPYLEAWSLIRKRSQPLNEFQKIVPFAKLRSSETHFQLGTLAMVANPETCFARRPSDDADDQASMVALVRQRGMVVAYEPFYANRPPFVHGVLLTHEDIEATLAKIEPKEHNRWWLGTRERTLKFWTQVWKDIVSNLYGRTYDQLGKFRNGLNSDAEEDQITMGRLGRKLGQLLQHRSRKGGTEGPISTGKAPVTLSIPESKVKRLVQEDGSVIYEQPFSAALIDEVTESFVTSRIKLQFNYEEDIGSVGDRIDSSYPLMPDGWIVVDGYLSGTLSKEPAHFVARTEPINGPFRILVDGQVEIDHPRLKKEEDFNV